MKKFSIKMLCVLVAMTVVFTSSVVAFAADGVADDAVIVANATAMTGHYFTNYVKKNADGVIEQNSNISPHNIYDIVADGTVRKYSTNAYYSLGSKGSEPRFYLVDPKSTKDNPVSLGGLDYSEYKYLKIAFNAYIGDTDDGVAFRFQRFNSESNAVDTAQDYYIGIGGSSYTAGSVTNGYQVSDKSLVPGKWHSVVIILGSTESDIKFYVDNELSASTVMKLRTGGNTIGDVTSFPEGTYGFGGYSNSCVVIPKSKNSTDSAINALDLRLQNFTMTATNTVYTPDTTAAPLNTVAYEMTKDSTMVTKTNKITKQEVAAPHITGKNAIHHYFKNFAAAATPGGETAYTTLTGSTGGILGNLDFSKYNNIKIRFNIYLNDSTNGVYFRARRLTNGTTTYRNDNYIFNIGGKDYARATAGSGTPYHYEYKGLETGKWYNVLMEIGANSSNTDVKYYVNGELVMDAADDQQMANDVYGFGGASTSWSVLAMKAGAGANLDFYLSDFMIIAANTIYNPENVVVPTAEGKDASVGFADGNVYALSEDVSIDTLEPVKGDYISFVELGGEKKLVAYNDTSKEVRYYGIISDGKLHAGDMVYKITEEGTTSVSADILNLTGKETAAKIIIAYYNGDDLVSAKIESVDAIAAETVRTYVSTSADEPDAAYNKIKIYAWADFTEMTPLADAYEYLK